MTHDQLTLDRLVAAPPSRVWEAWTTEAGLAGWWWVHWPGTTYAVDLRPGGSWLIEAVGHGVGVRGEFVELHAPERMVTTWVWLEDGAPGDVERVEVVLTAEDGGTRVVVRHSGPWTTSAPAESYAVGWAFVLDALADLLDPDGSAQRVGGQ